MHKQVYFNIECVFKVPQLRKKPSAPEAQTMKNLILTWAEVAKGLSVVDDFERGLFLELLLRFHDGLSPVTITQFI
jgi:hypothetical protein